MEMLPSHEIGISISRRGKAEGAHAGEHRTK
jgi:hypothetical protein